jgi:pilus assembly protein CpaB
MRRKWSASSKLFAFLGVVFGLGAFVLVQGYANRARALSSVFGQPRPVIEAAQDLARGTGLAPSMLRTASYPEAFAPPGAFRAATDVTGRILSTDLTEGEPVTATRLAPQGSGPVAGLVPAGLRAFVVPLDVSPALIHRGDHLDVLATFGGAHPHTETVATGVEVLLVHASQPSSVAGGDGPGTASLVLLVSPAQAEELAYSRAFAQITVSLEGPDEEVGTG